MVHVNKKILGISSFVSAYINGSSKIWFWTCQQYFIELITRYGPLTRYAKLRVAHAPGMPGTFSPPPRYSDPDMHHGTCLTHVPWCMPGLQTSGFLGSRWRGKRSRHSRRMRNPQFCASGKRPMLEKVSPCSLILSYVHNDKAVFGGQYCSPMIGPLLVKQPCKI